MSYSPSSASRLSIRRSKSLGLGEFDVLLNLIPEACLIIERPRDQVVLANSALLKITAFTQKELQELTLDLLIPGSAALNLAPDEEYTVTLNRRKRDPLQARLRASALDAEGQWLLLSIYPALELAEFANEEYAVLFDILNEMARGFETADIQELLQKAMKVVQHLLGASHVCVYQADSNTPRLNKIISLEHTPAFPEILSSSDLIRMSAVSIWMPGKRVLTDIHRAGRVGNFSYIASIPLGQDGALFGLLVVGDASRQAPQQPEPLLVFLGNLISGAIQKFILVENLRSENVQYERLLAVRNSLMEHTEVGIVVLHADLSIQEINPNAELMLGYADYEVKSQQADNILIGAEGLVPALEAAGRGLVTPNMGSIYLHRRNGQAFPAHVQVVPVMKEEDLLAVLIFITDVSADEQIRIQTQQLEHRAVLGEFTAIFAHEVRNPINNISTGLQLLSSRLTEEDQNQDVINRIQGDCTRLDHLMESVLAFSRPMESTFKPVDIGMLLQKILNRWQPRLARVNVNPFFHIAEATPMVMGDSRALEQVFTNLISNAVEAMSKTGGTLAIRIEPSDVIANRPQVEVNVSDNGPGIPEDLKDHIFEPFVTHNPRGTGLGLAITKRIVTAHQGSINVNSFPGGTMFHVYLPACIEE